MNEVVPGDIIIASHPSQADGYAGIAVERERIISNSGEGVRDDASLREVQRTQPEMTAFRYVGVWYRHGNASLSNAGYDPNEARIPAGQSGGGRWTDGGAMEARPQIAYSGGTPKSRSRASDLLESTIPRTRGKSLNCDSDGLKSPMPRMRGRLGPDGRIKIEILPDKRGDDDSEPGTPGDALKDMGGSFLSTLVGLVRSIFHPDDEASKPKSFVQLQGEIEEALRGMDMTTPKGLGRAVALGIVVVASEALSDATAGVGEVSLSKVIERGPEGVVDQLSSNLQPKSLSDVQVRDWYNATKVIRADIINKMRAAGYSEEEIAREAFELRNAARTKARELMSDRDKAAELEIENKNLNWDEVMKKYNGNYKKITEKSLESNKEIDRLVEQLRKQR